nr:MAG TPA: hypothetical protein [Caudoviricetes sp.]
MGAINVYLSASIKVTRRAKDGKDAVNYEILLDTDSVVLKSDTKQFETHKLGDVHFMYHQGSYIEDMTMRIIDTFSYIILYYGYEAKKDENGKPVLGSDGKPVMEYKAITYSSNEGITDIWNTMQMNVGDDAECYGMKYIWYDKNLPDTDEAMFEKIWSKLDGVPPTELGIKILATKMFTVRREADSIQSSDVVFGIGTKTQQPTAWITNFGGLTLADGKYVWTCTKTTLTNGTSYYTGAYCLGECYDFAQIEELYALSDSSINPPKNAVFSSSYKVVKGKYLWSCVKVTYNDANISYLNKKCVSYFPNDGVNGTKFTPKGTAYGHYTASSKMPKPSDDVLGLLYLVDKVDTLLTPINKPCVVWWRSLSAGSYILSYDVAEEGDAYNVGGTLWVHNGTVWKDFGSIQGPKGDDGEDALNIELSTDKILFSWDSKNKSYDVATKDITLVVKQGNNIINIGDYTINFQAVENFELGSNNKNIRTDGASDGYTYNISFYSAGIALKEYTFNASVNGKEQTVRYPASSCSVKMLITYNGITYTKIIAIEVSFVQMYGDTAWNTEQLSSTYGKLTAGYNGTLAQMESNISQNAKNIALKVSQTYYDENNKKVGERFSIIEQRVDKINIQVSATSDGLKNTGINITDGTIKMTAANFTLVNNNGVPTLGVDAFGNCSLKGTINATGGNFGSLQMTSFTDATGFEFYGMSAHTDGTSIIAASTYRLDYQGLYVGSGLRNNGGSVHIGNRGGITDGDFSWDEGVVNVEADNSGASNADISGIGVNVVGNPSHSAIGMKVSATGGKNNYAIYAENGDFRAENGAFIGVHRGNVTKIYNSDYTLKKTDSTIICNNTTKDISIYLPSDAVVGTFYRIIKKGKTVTLQSVNKNIGVVNNIDLMSSVSSKTAREWINCLWDGDCWNVEMSRS